MARKMALIPAEMLGQMKETPLIMQMSALDQDMGQILQNKQLSTDMKFLKYQDALQRYHIMVNDRDKPVHQVQAPPEQATARKIPRELLLRSIPQQKLRNAKLLADFIETIPELSVSERNEIQINGATIENSNIIDLFSDLTRDRRGGPIPRGHDRFVALLHDHNVPLEAIGNQRRRETFNTPVSSTANTPTSNNRRRHRQPSLDSIDELITPRQSRRLVQQGPKRNFAQMHRGWQNL